MVVLHQTKTVCHRGVGVTEERIKNDFSKFWLCVEIETEWSCERPQRKYLPDQIRPSQIFVLLDKYHQQNTYPLATSTAYLTHFERCEFSFL